MKHIEQYKGVDIYYCDEYDVYVCPIDGRAMLLGELESAREYIDIFGPLAPGKTRQEKYRLYEQRRKNKGSDHR
jgi:hypothetical protein